MKYGYRLNGKEITKNELFSELQGLTKWIIAQVDEAVAEGEPIPMFKTAKGPLVITVK